MQVQLLDIGKKFNRQWLYKDISFTMPPASSTAVVGNNGSGKSTLLQIIYGWQVATKGKVVFSDAEVPEVSISVAERSRSTEISMSGLREPQPSQPSRTSFAAPYLELPEELTLQELLHFHFKFKDLQNGFSFDDIISLSGLSGNEEKQIRVFSSGMKQRAKLMLALFAKHDLLLLDEPCSNLDEQGIAWYRQMIMQRKTPATTIIASNQTFEYDFCESKLNLADFTNK